MNASKEKSASQDKVPFVRITRVKPTGRKGIFSNLWLIIGGLAVLSIIWSFFSNDIAANQVALSNFISNFKNNKYAELDVRDDGKAIAKYKFILGTDQVKDLNLTDDSDTNVSSIDKNIEQIDLDKLVGYLKRPSFKQLIDGIRNPQSIVEIDKLFVGQDFIVASSGSKLNKTDYLVKDVSEEQFLSKLTEQSLETSELTAQVYYLRSAMGEVETQELQNNFVANKFEKIWVLDDVAFAMLKEQEITYDFVWQQQKGDFIETLQREGISLDSKNVEIKTPVIPRVPWGDLITFAILIGFGFLAIVMVRGIQGQGNSLMKFGQSKARMLFGRRPDITFKDVAGIDEAKEELQEIVLFLKEPKRFLNLGARIPKGVLMVGAPGTGKTLLARAIAGEAGVPFFHTSGSEFEEMLVGAGASRVRDLFEKAKKAAPSIIFIDEIDAVARKRGTTIQSGTTEQTLNQILVEMDGFEKNVSVIVIAATNRPDVLDTAILRPGRFDRRIVLDLPDIEGRKQIIAIHAKNKPLAKSVDPELVARRTVGFSGADLENMLNEAAIIVAKDNRKEIEFKDLEEAANKVQIGPARKRKRTDKELKMTAYHEAGHAIVMKKTPEHDPVHRVTIVSRGMALGYTMPLPETDEMQTSKTKMLSNITSLVAGFVTEEMIFGDVTSGASNDIEKASNIARRMVKHFGMSKKLGLVKYGEDDNQAYLGYQYEVNKNYSDETAKMIDEEVRVIINDCYQKAKKILEENRAILDKIVAVLLEKEVVEAEEFNAFFK